MPIEKKKYTTLKKIVKMSDIFCLVVVFCEKNENPFFPKSQKLTQKMSVCIKLKRLTNT